MPYSVPNQKWIQVHKPKLVSNFLSISNDAWMEANKALTPYGLQLYLYLAANADGYKFALSKEAADQQAGIKSTTFRKYIKVLEEKGYLVWRTGNVFDFYTTPRPESERTQPDHHCDSIEFENLSSSGRNSPCENAASCEFARQTANPPRESACSLDEATCSPSIIEIDNKYDTDSGDKDNITNNAGKPRTPPLVAANAATVAPREEEFTF